MNAVGHIISHKHKGEGRSEETYGFDEFGNDIRTAKDMMPEWRKILMVTKNL